MSNSFRLRLRTRFTTDCKDSDWAGQIVSFAIPLQLDQRHANFDVIQGRTTQQLHAGSVYGGQHLGATWNELYNASTLSRAYLSLSVIF